MHNIKVGDTVGKANFPHKIGVVVQVTDKKLLVELPPRAETNDQKMYIVVQEPDFKNGTYTKLDIEDGVIVKEKTKSVVKKKASVAQSVEQ